MVPVANLAQVLWHFSCWNHHTQFAIQEQVSLLPICRGRRGELDRRLIDATRLARLFLAPEPPVSRRRIIISSSANSVHLECDGVQ